MWKTLPFFVVEFHLETSSLSILKVEQTCNEADSPRFASDTPTTARNKIQTIAR